MPRRPKFKIRIRCNTCNDYTQSIEPIIINKESGNLFYIKAVCAICNKFKTKYLNKKQIRLLPDEIKSAPDDSAFNNTVIRNREEIPLLTLIPLIVSNRSNMYTFQRINWYIYNRNL